MRSVPSTLRQVRSWLGVCAAATSLACWEGKEIAPATTSIGDVITAVSLDGGTATATLFAEGHAPAAEGGPAATVMVESPAVVGGSTRVQVSSETPFERVILSLGYPEIEGYWEVLLPAPTTSAALIVTISPTSTFSPVPSRFAVGPAAGPLGDAAAGSIDVLNVGTGEVQVSISWDAQSDVDLHVIDPSGEEIFFGNAIAASGGELDLDSNAACVIDGKRNENVTWPFGRAPRGTYTVIVNYWSDCDVAQTRYVVTVRREGHAPQTFTGTFTGAASGPGGGADTVTTFTY